MEQDDVVTSISIQSENIWFTLRSIIANRDEMTPILVPGFSYSFYITAAAAFEGLLYKTITNIVERDQRIKFKNRQKIFMSGFAQYQGLFKLYTGIPLSFHLNNNENWKAIKTLYVLRNYLAHGQDISVSHVSGTGLIYPPNLEKVHRLLMERQLCPRVLASSRIAIIDITKKEIMEFFLDQLELAWNRIVAVFGQDYIRHVYYPQTLSENKTQSVRKLKRIRRKRKY